jgi:hypothetical protein
VFNPLAESLKTPAASFMNHFNFGDPVLFSDAYSENLDSMWFDIYVTLNAIAAVVGTFILEQVLKRAR